MSSRCILSYIAFTHVAITEGINCFFHWLSQEKIYVGNHCSFHTILRKSAEITNMMLNYILASEGAMCSVSDDGKGNNKCLFVCGVYLT